MHKVFLSTIAVAALLACVPAASYGLEPVTYPIQPTTPATSDSGGKSCDPNIPIYSQPGCVEQGTQKPSPYSPPTTSTPYELPSVGPVWNPPSVDVSENAVINEEPEKELSPADLIDMTKSLLKETGKLPALVDGETQALNFFSIDKKDLEAEISEYITNLNNAEKRLRNGEMLTDEQLSEELGEFDHEYLREVLSGMHSAYTIARKVSAKDIRTLLVKHFKPIAVMIKSGDYAGAYEMLEPYLAELTKNQNLYLAKKLSKNVKQKVQKNLVALGKKIDAIQKEIGADVGKEAKPETEKPEKKEAEVKKPLPVDTKRISEDTKKINEAVQRGIQNDAQNRVWNLYQKSIFGY